MFGYAIETQVDINASPEAVMARLVDAENIGKWSTFIVEMKIISDHATVQEGCQLSVMIDPKESGKPMEFKPRVLKKTDTELRWLGVLGGFLFLGEHYFIVKKNESGNGTTLTHGESFSGPLGPLMKLVALEDTKQAFARHNEQLRSSFENGSRR
jgi:hypothetical protein